MLFKRQALVQAAYESAKVAAHRNGTNATAEIAAKNVASGRRIANIEVVFDPPDVSAVTRGQVVRVSVTATGRDNTLFNIPPFNGIGLSGQAAMIKE